MKTTIKEMLTVLALTICLILAGYAAGIAQTTQNFKGKDYQVQTGTRGGKYIVIETGEKIYLSSYVASKPELTNDTIATYKGKKYPIHTGSRGGKYIITESGTKVYLSKQEQATN